MEKINKRYSQIIAKNFKKQAHLYAQAEIIVAKLGVWNTNTSKPGR